MGVIIIGSGGFGKEVLDFLRQKNEKIIGFISNDRGSVSGIPILGGDEILPDLIRQQKLDAYIAIGKPQLRKKIYQNLESLGYNLPNLIHCSAIISQSAEIGKACIIYPGVVVNTEAKIGNSVILNSNSSIGHESVLEDFVSVNPNAAIAGKVKIRECSYIGIGACTIENLAIGKGVIVGAGAVVIRDLPDYVTAVGVPARIIKTRDS